jgi:hypothetical protein
MRQLRRVAYLATWIVALVVVAWILLHLGPGGDCTVAC